LPFCADKAHRERSGYFFFVWNPFFIALFCNAGMFFIQLVLCFAALASFGPSGHKERTLEPLAGKDIGSRNGFSAGAAAQN